MAKEINKYEYTAKLDRVVDGDTCDALIDLGFNTWVKKNKKADSFFWGMGHWTRANAECCLLATIGKPKRVSKGVHQIIFEPIREHSRKPDIARTRIIELCGDLPRIELFARQKVDGWDCWGNEVEEETQISLIK